MNSRQNSNINMRAESVAIDRASAGYGVASGVRVSRSENSNLSVTLSWSDQFSYLFTEYFKGILFVVLTTFFIFAVPAYITKPAKVHAM